MNHHQLCRKAVYPLLNRYNLLIDLAAADQPNPVDFAPAPEFQAGSKLVKHGLSLLDTLCAELSIEIFSVEADDSFLQGSLAKFEPNLPDDQSLGGLIYYSRELDDKERVFAIAHELAHFCLHWGQLTACQRQDLALDNGADDETGAALFSGEVEVYNLRNLREREANSFALELLMPSAEVRAEYYKLLVAASKQAQNQPVAQLAQHFEVSSYRLLMQLANVFLAGPLPPFNSENNSSPATTEAVGQPPLKLKLPVELDKEQQTAVQARTPALVLAGPGSGKTRTLVERVGYLVKGSPERPPLNPAHLLVLTFSNKAASELRERLAAADLPAEQMLISTFHAYGVEFLRRYAERVGLSRDFRLLDPAHAYMLMEELLAYFPAGYYVNPYNPYGYLGDLLTDISRAKDYLHTPAEYELAVEQMANATPTEGLPVYKPEDIAKARERAIIFGIYEEHKKKRNLVDFSDLLLLPAKLLEQDSEVLQAERQRYQQVLVDEFQDINYASGKLLQWLCSPACGGTGNIWAVGDLNQSIYRFRGAFPQQAGAKAFAQDYGSSVQPATVLELSYNYRSRPPIVSLANHLRSVMPNEGVTIPLQATREAANSSSVAPVSTKGLFYTAFPTTANEMATIAADIEQHRQAGYAYSDHAILCQRHVQADKLAEALTAVGIPVSRLGPFFNRPEIQVILALLTLMNKETPLTLLTLGQGQLATSHLLDLLAENNLTVRDGLKNEAVLNELDSVGQAFAKELAILLERLDSYRSMWLLVVQYLFDYSPAIFKLLQPAQDSFATRQQLRALGQFLRLVAGFDREEEATLYQAEESKLGRPLTFKEQERLRQIGLRPAAQRQKLLHYINALVQSATRIELGEDTATEYNTLGRVQIITAHTSKGLEFPFVYLPGLHQPGNPPSDPTQPTPPNFHFLVGDSQREDLRCLFYVSITRARDVLYLSWAEQTEDAVESSNTEDEGGSTKPTKSIRLRQPGDDLQVALEHRKNYPEAWSSLPILSPTANQAGLQGLPGVSSKVGPATKAPNNPVTVVDYPHLHLYEQCPSRYYYQYVLRGQGSARTQGKDEKARFYQSLATAQEHLYTNLFENGSLPDLATTLAIYEGGWPAPAVSTETETEGSYYRLQGLKTLQALHRQQQQNTLQRQPVAVDFDVLQTVRLKHNSISFRISRVETLADGSKRLIHSRIKALPRDETKLDSDSQKPWRLLTLYALANPSTGAPNSPKIILEAVGTDGASQLEVPKAYKKAQTYQKWLTSGAGSPGLLDTVDKLATSLRAGKFEPHKGEHCTACPFYTLVCPTKPA